MIFLFIRPGCAQMIGRIENISGNNRLVMIPLTVLRSIIVVLLCLVCKEVWCESLPRQHIPTMAFVCNDAGNRARIPFCVPKFCLPLVICQEFRNILQRKSIQVQVINDLYCLSLIPIHHKVTILILVISKQRRRKEKSTAEPAINGPVHDN